MNSEREWEGPDAAWDRLRAAVMAVDQEILRLPRRTTDADSVDGLFDSWGALRDLLPLGPPPELRQCPNCGHVGMRAAASCGYCWAKLPAMPR